MRNTRFLSLNFTPYIIRLTPAPYFLRTGRDTAGTYKEREMPKGCIQLITRQIIHVQKTVPSCSANRPYLAAK